MRQIKHHAGTERMDITLQSCSPGLMSWAKCLQLGWLEKVIRIFESSSRRTEIILVVVAEIILVVVVRRPFSWPDVTNGVAPRPAI